MRSLFLMALAVTTLAPACARDPRRSEASLLAAAYSAIAGDDWERYARLIVTPTDLIDEANRVGRWEQGLTYEGSVLRPEELQQHRQWFDQARRGGVDLIDFRADRLDRGRWVAHGEQELLSGEIVETAVYAADLKGGIRREGPLFELVRRGTGFSILALRFPPVAGAGNGPAGEPGSTRSYQPNR